MMYSNNRAINGFAAIPREERMPYLKKPSKSSYRLPRIIDVLDLGIDETIEVVFGIIRLILMHARLIQERSRQYED